MVRKVRARALWCSCGGTLTPCLYIVPCEDYTLRVVMT